MSNLLLALLVGVVLIGAPIQAHTVGTNPTQPLPSLALALGNPQLAFETWAAALGKNYAHPAEKHARLEQFTKNVEYIAYVNAAETDFQLGLNAFADLSFEEFAATHLGVHPQLGGKLRERTPSTEFMYNDSAVPNSIDWRAKGAVTPVKNQQFCGSCWAFSTTGSVEGINAIRTGQLVSLSEQQLVDCDTKKDLGCGGGLMDYAFQYIIDNGGIDTEDDYAYWSIMLACQTIKEKDRHAVTIDGFEDVPVNDEAALQKAVANQPVSVAICASANLQFYSSGIVSSGDCTDLDHGVLAVGYDEGAGGTIPHWIVKNSWGSSWGESGFFRLKMHHSAPEGFLGIAKAPSYPVKKTNKNPPLPEICGWPHINQLECAPKHACTCTWDFLFGLFCVQWGCGPASA